MKSLHRTQNVTVASGTVAVSAIAASSAVTGPLTDTQLRNSDIKVTLDSETVAVTGSLAVTGPLTDTELRAADVPVSLGSERVELADSINEALQGIFTELRLIAHLLNEGLNTKEDLDTLRNDYESELGG
jgi:hypothetical protein